MALIANNNRIVTMPGRYQCILVYGGHNVYFNQEFGNLWCYRCGCSWKCDPPVVLARMLEFSPKEKK